MLDSGFTVGARNNAGAFASPRVPARGGGELPLIDAASLHLLEAAIAAVGLDTTALWTQPQDWTAFEPFIDPWGLRTGDALAHAIRSIGSVMDLEAMLIDGTMPAQVRDRVVARTREALSALDTRSVLPPAPRRHRWAPMPARSAPPARRFTPSISSSTPLPCWA